MQETVPSPAIGDSRPSSRLDSFLTIFVWLLVSGVLAFAGYFGYTVYATTTAAKANTPAMRAVEELKVAVRKWPNDAALRVRLGEALATAGMPKEAAEQLGNAIKLNPKHIGAYLDLGLVASREKEYGKAEGYFRKVVDLTEGAQYENVNTMRESALFYLGQLQVQQKRYTDAVESFKAALRIRRDSSDTLFNLAMAYKALNQDDQAIRQLEVATAYDPGYAEAHYELGQLYLKKKDTVNGSSQLALAAKYAPDADPVREAMSSLGTAAEWKGKADKALASGDLNEAIDDILIARNLDPNNVGFAKMNAQLAERKGDKKAALAIYQAALKLAPNDAEIKAAVQRLSRKK